MSTGKTGTAEPAKTTAKKIRKSISLDTKMLVITRMESGEKRASVCRSLTLAPTTVSTIMRNAEKIKKSAQQTSKFSSKYVAYTRSPVMEKMEQILTRWVFGLNQRGITPSINTIAKQAKSIFDDLQRKEGGTEKFVASTGWFARFKCRSQMFLNVLGHSLPDEEVPKNSNLDQECNSEPSFSEEVNQNDDFEEYTHLPTQEIVRKSCQEEEFVKPIQIQEQWDHLAKFEEVKVVESCREDEPIQEYDPWDHLTKPEERAEQLTSEIHIKNEISDNESSSTESMPTDDHFKEVTNDNEEPMPTEALEEILATISNATQSLCNMDPDYDRSFTVNTVLNYMLRPYREILEERKKRSNN